MNFGLGDEQVEAAAIAAPPAPRDPPTVFVADDEAVSRRVLKSILAGLGFRVQQFAAGEAALAALEAGPPDLIILDAYMPPGMNGFQICRTLREREDTREVPIVMATGLTEQADRAYGLQAGIDDYLCKPLQREEVAARASSLLDRQRLLRSLATSDDALRSLVRLIAPTAPHSERVACLAAAFGEWTERDPAQVATLCRAGLFHDVGKVVVPLPVIDKAGELTDEERRLIRCHPERGYQIASHFPVLRDALPAIRWHHERIDGTGYPDGLQGDEIPEVARIVAVATLLDSFVAGGLAPEQAIGILRSQASRGWWCPDTVERFAQLVEARGVHVRPARWTGLDRTLFPDLTVPGGSGRPTRPSGRIQALQRPPRDRRP